MNIFHNSFIKLDYEPTTDVLSVNMPTVNVVNMSEVKHTLEIIVEHVRSYDVKRLLVDARKTEIEIDEDIYTAIVSEFSRSLMATRLQKVARIVSSSTVRENVVKKVYGENKLTLEFKNFTDIAPAMEWLVQRER
ncbi:hypothetical protein DXT99_23275 [Pontibacter diazotrophicus]|uniref:STAS/SEC14 domain-containing protein n=1 Tax=Pontibacter diazotrophicus TaxID=1400979 RepID=A0A3D8L3V7_9BACT|nr:hypothetical protein [Pontibacter diazotrophicus]RDV11947.1 hypothetical protein DXT99_23275 [Pontibacter diazotrophicus]